MPSFGQSQESSTSPRQLELVCRRGLHRRGSRHSPRPKSPTRDASRKRSTGSPSSERAILEIEKQARGLDEITRSAQTIKSGSEKILKRAGIMREALNGQIELLGDKVQELRDLLEEAGGA